MSDFVAHGENMTLTIGIRNSTIVFGIANKAGKVFHVALGGATATSAAVWLTEAAANVPKVGGAAILRAASSAMTAYEQGVFVRKTSKEMWSQGFDCESENCEWAQGEDWSAIYDPDLCELEVYVGQSEAVRVNLTTGAVVPL